MLFLGVLQRCNTIYLVSLARTLYIRLHCALVLYPRSSHTLLHISTPCLQHHAASAAMVVPNQTPAAEERDVQRSYWKEHSTEATVEAMMLDSQASVIDQQERPEVRGRDVTKRRLLRGAVYRVQLG